MQKKLKQMEERNSLISKALEEKIDRHFIGVSKEILYVYEQARTMAKYRDANVLITGESGTGKENIAPHHSLFIQGTNTCFMQLTAALLLKPYLSEFFGHKKGSFTGAVSDK